MRWVTLLILAFGAIAYGSELDLPVLRPNDERREEYIPDALPIPPKTPELDLPVAPPVFFGEEIGTDNGSLIYVLDFSQSMGVVHERVNYNTTLSRWKVVQREARASISRLADDLRFGVIVFGTGRGCGVRSWVAAPISATEGNKAAAIAWLEGFESAMIDGGATPTAPAVLLALSMQPGAVVLLSDGAPSPCGLTGNPHRSHRRAILAANMDGVRVDVFGIGLADQYSRSFALGVASDSGGTFVEVY